MTIQRRDGIFTSELDDALLMLSIEQGRYFSVDGAGPRIWALLEHPTTEAQVVAELRQEFDVTPEVCATEVAAFVMALREQNLLIESD